MISERMTALLKETAKEARDGIQPLSHEFLVRNDVTLTEAFSLADWVDSCIGITLQLDKTKAGQDLMAQSLASHLVEREL